MAEYDVLKELYELLMIIKARPGMYLGKKSLSALNMYINGFLMGAQIFVGGEKFYKFFPGFQEWIA